MMLWPLLLQAAAPVEVAPALCAPGLYLIAAADAAPQPLRETLSDHRKVGGLVGYVLLGGMTSLKVKTVLAGKAAAIRTSAARPDFLFCADAEQAQPTGGGMGYVGVSAGVSSPRELRLVRFDVQGEQREVPLSAMSITGPKTGAIEKSIVRFSVEELAPGRYRMSLYQPLVPGEYGFMKTAGNTTVANGNKVAQERFFDFAVE